MATLCAFDLLLAQSIVNSNLVKSLSVLSLYTFGSPRVGNY